MSDRGQNLRRYRVLKYRHGREANGSCLYSSPGGQRQLVPIRREGDGGDGLRSRVLVQAVQLSRPGVQHNPLAGHSPRHYHLAVRGETRGLDLQYASVIRKWTGIISSLKSLKKSSQC